MMNYTKGLLAGVACLCLAQPLAAQEFDLSSQRGESQHVLRVPGQVIDHHGVVINPQPHHFKIFSEGSFSLKQGFSVKDRQKAFAGDIAFLPQKKGGIKVNIDFGSKVAIKLGVKALSGAYTLNVSKKGISITGYDERGAFYGLQTLHQLLGSQKIQSEGQLPYLSINDYPDLPNRGVVEGFYGTPWSHEVRKSLIAFYGTNKMNAYLYGPKDDPYHSSPNWRLPYPEKEATQIKDLIDACHRARVDFVWAIHPGKDIKWNEEDYQNLVAKFNKMYDLGVRDFAIFFDDIEGEGTNPVKQVELLNRLTDEFVKQKGDVSPLTVCPTDYSKLWANPTEKGSLAIYGRTLNPEIKIFWTGDVVCSDLTPSTLEFINSRIKRPAYYWWNFPVTDYARHIVMQGPVYGLDTTLTAEQTCGVISNPMEHGEASKLGLYGVADYSWNVKEYNAIDNWERGLAALMPTVHQAYRTFAIHSADTENGYRRDESWETKTFSLKNWSAPAAQALKEEFERVAAAPGEIERGCSNKLLVGELKPWLDEFGKLGLRGLKVLDLMKVYRQGDDARFWQGYVDNLMSPADRKSYNAHKSGTMKLQPFYENGMDDMAHGFVAKVSGRTPNDYQSVGSFSACATVLSKLMLDGDTISHFTSGQAQRPNDWIGLDLRDVRDVSEISILQGRNSVDDVDYFDHVALQVSADGRKWTTLMDDMKKQYVINWTGAPVKARYVRLLRLDSKKTNYAAIREFRVNPLRLDNLGFKLEAPHTEKALAAFDFHPATTYALDGTLRFEWKKDNNEATFLLGKITRPVTVRQLDKKGKVVSETQLTSSYAKVSVVGSNVVAFEVDGQVEIFEIITR